MCEVSIIEYLCVVKHCMIHSYDYIECILLCLFIHYIIVPCVNFTGGPYEVTEGGGSMVIMLELTGGDNITVTITPSPADVNGAIGNRL